MAAVLVPPLLFMPLVTHAQPAGLPELGDSASVTLSPRVEARLGDALMAEGRRDPTYIDDPAVNQYLSGMANRLAQYASGGPPRLEVFSIRNPSINAFAMPGGYIGVHSGLVVATANESELAGVVAHEIAHVTQRHVARGLAQQGQSSALMMGVMLGALAAAVAGAGQLAAGAAAFGQAAMVNAQLSFSRDAEREADRIGIQMMQGAGYDPAGMVSMFARLMQTARFNQGPGPSYASTHPLSIDRMSDMQNRARNATPRGDASSDTYWFVRARLRVAQATASRVIDPIAELRNEAQGSSGVRAAAAWYGVGLRALQQGDRTTAAEALEQARATRIEHPMLAGLAIDLAIANQEFERALQASLRGIQRWPDDRALALSHARLLMRLGHYDQAVSFLETSLTRWPEEEPVLYRLAAEAQAQMRSPVAEARLMAEYYERMGAWPAALNQMQRARAASTDFHEQSRLDARIREIRNRIEEDRALLAEFRL